VFLNNLIKKDKLFIAKLILNKINIEFLKHKTIVMDGIFSLDELDYLNMALSAKIYSIYVLCDKKERIERAKKRFTQKNKAKPYIDYVDNMCKNYGGGAEDYYSFDYVINNNEIIFSPIIKVSKEYIEISEGERNKMELKELETKVAELEKSIADKDATIATKDTEIAQKSQELETKQNEIAEKDKQIETLSASVIEKDNAIKELEPYKAEVERINAEKSEVEKAEKKIAIKEKYSKLLSAEILAETEIASAIENLDEKVLNERVVQYALEKSEKNKEKKPVITTASRITENISINGNSVVDKYITINK